MSDVTEETLTQCRQAGRENVDENGQAVSNVWCLVPQQQAKSGQKTHGHV